MRWSPPEQNAWSPSPVRMITPTAGSSRASVKACGSSNTVSGRKALRTSGRLIVILAMPSAVSYRMSEYSWPSAGPDRCQSTTARPSTAVSLICPVNLTTMTSRPLHAVLLPAADQAARLLEALGAALEGTGPAILPVDPRLPGDQLAALLAALRPDTLETPQGTERLDPGGRPALAPETAVVIATSGSTGEPKGAELSAAALRHSARASLARLGARPGQRWLSCLPPSHISGLAVFVRSLLAGTAPAVAGRVDAGRRPAATTCRWCRPRCATCWTSRAARPRWPRSAASCSAARRSRPGCWRRPRRRAPGWSPPTG